MMDGQSARIGARLQTAAGWAVALVIVIAGCGGVESSARPSPTAAAIQAEAEATLLAGMRLDLANVCRTAAAELPVAAIAGLDCQPRDAAISDLRVYLFDRESDMLDAYFAVIAAEGIEPRTTMIDLPVGESSYWPERASDPLSDGRHVHWVDDAGYGHYVATTPPFVLFEIDGADANVDGLYQWAWRGNQDQPGGPTVWSPYGPADPNAKG